MASAVSPSRKRKSSSSELDNGSSSKKMKEAEKSTRQSSSHLKRSKTKSKKDIKASLKTVSELAKLVTSGAVEVPKSLVNYTSDKAILLDQVFTILSPSDVSGMLPDILKGLKTKRVKNLCFEQLKSLSVEQIKRALQSEDNSPTGCDVTSDMTSSASNQTQTPAVISVSGTSKEANQSVKRETQVPASQSKKRDDRKKDEDKDTFIEKKQKECDKITCKMEGTKDTFPEKKEKERKKDTRTSSLSSSQRETEEIAVQLTGGSGREEEKRLSKQTRPAKERDTATKGRNTSKESLRISKQMKEREATTERHGATKEDAPFRFSKQIRLTKERDTTMEEGDASLKQTKEKDTITEGPYTSREDTPLENKSVVTSPKMMQQKKSVDQEENVKKDKDSSNVELIEKESVTKVAVHTDEVEASCDSEDKDDLDMGVSEVDAAELIEMELRRRALESVLKNISNNSQPTKPKDQTFVPSSSASISEEDSPLEVFVSVSDMETLECGNHSGSGEIQSPSTVKPMNSEPEGEPHVSGTSGVKGETGTLDLGELLEMKLREKALQSMIVKRRNRNSKQ